MPCFLESQLKGETNVVLDENISIPGWVEMIILGHATKILKSKVGMVAPTESEKLHPEFTSSLCGAYSKRLEHSLKNLKYFKWACCWDTCGRVFAFSEIC